MQTPISFNWGKKHFDIKNCSAGADLYFQSPESRLGVGCDVAHVERAVEKDSNHG